LGALSGLRPANGLASLAAEVVSDALFDRRFQGHNSKAVHAAYAKKAEVRVPSLDQWEKQMNTKVVEVQFSQEKPGSSAGQHQEGEMVPNSQRAVE
jgi:hypothetical protein